MKKAVFAAFLVATSLAGCFSSDGGPDYAALDHATRTAALDVLVQDHDHFDAALHNGSQNMRLVAYHNGFDDTGDASHIPAGGTYTELAVTEKHVYLARSSVSDGLTDVTPDAGYGGFVILDIEDPEHPYVLGEYNALGGSDIEVNDDETLAFFATQRNGVAEIAGGLLGAPSANAAFARGIHVVDIRDKTAPRLVAFEPLPINGPHTLTYYRHDNGEEYLIACTYDLITDPGTGALLGTVPLTQRVLVYQIMDGPTLVPVNEFQILEQAPPGKLYFPHDVTIRPHPTEGGRTLMYVAYWDKGVQILDFTDPTTIPLPVVDSFTDFHPSNRTNIHQVRAFRDLIAGHAVAVAEPEIVQADETGFITFLDVTDPERVHKLGDWTLPGDLFVTDLDFSPHNFDVWDGKVALAHYHAGVWVLDVSNEANLGHPVTAGFYMPNMPRPDSPRMQPDVWGVFEQDVDGRELLFASDQGTGLYILEYTGP